MPTTMNSCGSPATATPNVTGAVLVDSLLCFLHNFRQQPQLQQIVLRHFSPATIRHSLKLLNHVCDDNPSTNAEETEEDYDEELLLRTLLTRLDRICASGQAPIFASADLLSLPFRLLHGPDSLLEDELRQIRFLLQDWLLLRRSASPSLLNSAILPSHLAANFISSSPNVISSPECSASSGPQSGSPVQQGLQTAAQSGSSGDSSPFSQSPSKGHRISQVLQKLSRGKETIIEPLLEMNNNETEADKQQPPPPMTAMDDEEVLPTEEEKQPHQQQLMATFAPPSMAASFTSWQAQMIRQLAIDTLQKRAGQFVAINGGAVPAVLELHRQESSLVDDDDQRMLEDDDDDHLEEEENDQKQEENGQQTLDSSFGSAVSETSPLRSDCGASSGRETANSRSMDMEEDGEEGGEEKPYFCAWTNCQKRFANKFLLKKHQFIHSGQKPHICQFCKKPFNRKDNLLRHKKTHLQNGMNPVETTKRRHNMLRGITENEAIEMQLLPLGCREGRQQKAGNGGRSKNSKVEQQQEKAE